MPVCNEKFTSIYALDKVAVRRDLNVVRRDGPNRSGNCMEHVRAPSPGERFDAWVVKSWMRRGHWRGSPGAIPGVKPCSAPSRSFRSGSPR